MQQNAQKTSKCKETGKILEKNILKNRFTRLAFKETLRKLNITEKLTKYRRRVLKLSFFPANLVSMFSLNKE